MSDLKTSLLINRQVPEFIREEYPNFILFLEAYYEFLENSDYGKNKDFRNISDVDLSMDEFQQQFFNSFLPFIPKDTALNKESLIKNILPIFLSKGSEKSYKLLFRMLFGEEIKLQYPKNNILRASDGRWFVENVLLFNTELYSDYISDGIRTVYYLPYEMESTDVEVYVSGSLVTNYVVRKETRKLTFNTAPSDDATVRIYYRGIFDTSIFRNRRVIGLESGASTILESVSKKTVSGLNYYQFFIDKRGTIGSFISGETAITDVIFNGEIIPISLQTLADVTGLNIVNGGSNYSLGDNLIFRGVSKRDAIAIVNQISTGNIVVIDPKIGKFGSGYKIGDEVYANNYNSSLISAFIDAVDSSGTISPNTLIYNTDIISTYANDVISSSFVDINNNISSELTLLTLNSIGPILNVSVVYSGISSNSTPNFVANSSILFGDVRVSNLGTIGTIKVLSGGSNYSIGDDVIFTNTQNFRGQYAKAEVTSVSRTGSIRYVTVTDGGYGYSIEYPPTMTVNTANGSGAVLQVSSIMGRDAEFSFVPGDGIPGKITSVKILDPGVGYTTIPIVDASQSGDGNAVITANIRNAFGELPGKWTTSDSILSTDETRLQGRDYFIDFSYVITAQVEFQQYKDIIKNLLHPAGFINYSVYNLLDSVNTSVNFVANDTLSLEVAGTVSTNGSSNTVIGTNTYFVMAANLGLTSSANISIGDEIKTVNTIINNTSFTVTTAFANTYSGNVINLMD